jgi:hypothetical protein
MELKPLVDLSDPLDTKSLQPADCCVVVKQCVRNLLSNQLRSPIVSWLIRRLIGLNLDMLFKSSPPKGLRKIVKKPWVSLLSREYSPKLGLMCLLFIIGLYPLKYHQPLSLIAFSFRRWFWLLRKQHDYF